MMLEKPLLKIEDLILHFRTTKGSVRAVDKVNFALGYNEAVVVLGEAAAGKVRWPKPCCACCPRMCKRIPAKWKSTAPTSWHSETRSSAKTCAGQ
jgi:ABC-type dipeptide/oligopeptide/nickel transport system ATPase component